MRSIDPDMGKQIVALKNHIVAGFNDSHWRELGMLTSHLEQVEHHPHLLRSLSFGDDDYDGHVLSMLQKMVSDDPDNLNVITDYVREKCPEAGEFISSEDSSTRRIVFSPNVFRVPNADVDYSLVSAMMPFSGDFTSVYDVIKSASSSAGLTCKRADDIWDDSTVIQDIFSLIFQSYIVVCDFTGKNPNVFYEAGLAHALGKHVIPITQVADDIPFDLRHHRYIPYLDNSEGRGVLEIRLLERFKTLVNKGRTLLRGKVPSAKQRTTRSPDPRDDLKNLIIDRGLSADLLGGESPSLLECVQATRACYLPVADKKRPVVKDFQYNHFFGLSTVILIESPTMRGPSLLWYPRVVRAGEPANMSRKGWSILFHGSFKFHVVRENCPMDEWVQLALRNRECAAASFVSVPDGTLFALIDYKVRLPPVKGMCQPFAIITRDLRKSESRVYTQYVFQTTVSLPEATTMEAVNSVLATFKTQTDAPLSFVPADINHDYFLTPAESGKLMDCLAFRGLHNTERTRVCEDGRFTRGFRLL